MAKRSRKAVDPKEKLRILKEDVEKKTAMAAKAQEKLKEEENRQFEKCVREMQQLLVRTGGDINDIVELLRLFAKNDISLPDEIHKLSGEQLGFINEKVIPDSPMGNEQETVPDKAVNADDK